MRRIGMLLMVALVGSLARAEGADTGRDDITTHRARINSADSVLPSAGGMVAIGGSALRQLKPGASRWEVVHRLSGDSLYRVATDDSGRLLAAWEKDPFIHYFTAGPKRQHTRFPKPVPSPGQRRYQVDTLFFLPNSRHALVVMSGSLSGIGMRWSHAVYRLALDGKSEPELLFQEDGGYLLHASRNSAVFARSKSQRPTCDGGACSPISEIMAFDLSGGDVTQRTLLTSDQVAMSSARIVRGSNQDRVVVMLGLGRGERALLRWRPGEATTSYRPLPKGSMDDLSMVTRTDEFVELTKTGDTMSRLQLVVTRYLPEGGEQVVTLPHLQTMDWGDHGIGMRSNGTLWLHWGDHLILLSPDKPPRSFIIEQLLERKTEFAGVDIYVEKPESLWVGIEAGPGRYFARVSFAEAEKRAKQLPAAQ